MDQALDSMEVMQCGDQLVEGWILAEGGSCQLGFGGLEGGHRSIVRLASCRVNGPSVRLGGRGRGAGRGRYFVREGGGRGISHGWLGASWQRGIDKINFMGCGRRKPLQRY